MEKKKKVYLNSVYIKEHTFADGNSILNISINASRFNNEVQAINGKNPSKYFRFSIAKLKDPREYKGMVTTHYAYTFVDSLEDSNDEPEIQSEPEQDYKDDLPF